MDVREESHGCSVQRPIKQTRPQLHGAIEPRIVERISGEVAQRGVGQQDGFATGRRAKCDQRAMPIDLVLAGSHGWIDHSITEQSAGGKSVGHMLEIIGCGPRTVQQQLVLVAPNLGIAGHRFIVEADVVLRGAQEHASQLVLGPHDGQFVFVAMDPLPAVRATKRVANRTVDVRFMAVAGACLVQPARLWNADRIRGLVAEERLQEGNLPGQWQLALEFQVRRRAEEDKTARKRQQVQLAGQIGLADCRGQELPGAEGQQIADAAERTLFPAIGLRPFRQRLFFPSTRGTWRRRRAAAGSV